MMDWGDPRLPKRFWAKTEVCADTGCWVWTAYTDPAGYGRFCVSADDRSHYAHRYAREECSGPTPAGMHTDHLCRNRACVNPAHLEVVTPKVNVLRGEGPCAKHAAKTHCKHGHEFAGDNLIVYRRSSGRTSRVCRTCSLRRSGEQAARKRSARTS